LAYQQEKAEKALKRQREKDKKAAKKAKAMLSSS
jgi:hypothetical protein